MKKISRILLATCLVSLTAASIAFASPGGDGWEPPDDSQKKQAIAETARMQNNLNNLVAEILNTKIGN